MKPNDPGRNPAPPDSQSVPAAVELEVSTAPKVSLALQQNAVPVIRELRIHNGTDSDFKNLSLEIRSDPEFLTARQWPIDRLNAKHTASVNELRVDLSPAYLENLEEAIPGYIELSLRCGAETLARERRDVRLLAKHEWGGITDLPEIIAAFVQPNDPAVAVVLREASKVLEKAGRPAALDGYRTKNPQRAALIASAIWTALARQDLSYAVNPASFEVEGQKIRLPSMVLKERLATCLDLTVLYAACLEQAGLHPVIVFAKEHAFVGCWLVDIDFSRSVIDDAQAFRKRVDLKEMIAIETTMVSQRPPGKFNFAVAEGRRQLLEGNILLGVDIHRARNTRILPLSDPKFERYSVQAEADAVAVDLDVLEGIPTDYDDAVNDSPPPSIDSAKSRLEHWKRKLLDLSLRNPLLNYQAKKRAIHFIVPEPGLLEDKIADGEQLSVQSVATLFSDDDPRSKELHLQRRMEDLEREQILGALERKNLLAQQEPEKLNVSLVELYRASRAALAEGGANILYLAFGFLEWQRPGQNSRSNRAPLILIPVELTRRSAASPFKLKLLDDEPRLNPTLLQMLAQDFNLDFPEFLETLPKDDHGLDVDGIWNTIRQRVRDIEGWEVRETVVLSTFSFSKYLMWVDLEARTEILKNNPLVAHLIDTPRDPYGPAKRLAFVEPSEIDDNVHPKDIFMPLKADSSQMSAVLSAEAGKDFVLEGPPGTGKSQTIANIIGQCLAGGRTILFVSEKTAALDVVYRRLEEIGLGEFCLELHSHKARKTQVLEQLNHAWHARADLVSNWESNSEKAKTYASELNQYVRSLHLPSNNGITPFRAFGAVIKNSEVPLIPFAWPSPDVHDASAVGAMRDICGRLDVNAVALGTVVSHPFNGVGQTEWSPDWQSKLVGAAQHLAGASESTKEAVDEFCGQIEFTPNLATKAHLDALVSIGKLLQKASHMPYHFVFGDDAYQTIADVTHLQTHVSGYQQQFNQMSVKYQRASPDLSLPLLQAEWMASGSRWFLSRWLARRKVRKALQACTSEKVQFDAIGSDIEALIIAHEHVQQCDAVSHLERVFPRNWKGVDTESGFISETVDWANSIQLELGKIAADTSELATFRQQLRVVLSDGQSMLQPGGSIHNAADRLADAADRFNECLNDVIRITFGVEGVLFEGGTGDYLSRISAECQQWLKGKNSLRDWCAWQSTVTESGNWGIRGVAEALIDGTAGNYSAEYLFDVNYQRWWVNAHVQQTDVLREFIPAEHSRTVGLFNEVDDELRTSTSDFIRARLAGAIPDPNDVEANSEWSVLARELQKKRQHKPLRQLIGELPKALTQLTPCVMMSPMSIAQYLPPDGNLFDLVIFDEASQIPTWDAIGAIARGKQSIIVGDPKQLPPTSFFERRDSEYADEDVEVEDLESILDECLGANLPMKRLNWHYRSRCESLIAFSNWHYYDGRLVTFPANDTKTHSVSFDYVKDGVYARGGACTNQIEAKKIVADIVQHLKDPDFHDTIGVVTFNSKQQELVEDLLDEARRGNPEIEPHFSDDNFEPVFVKNLESVQGDERDRMYFSITYGRDITGKSSVNFGPMNQAGGQRRLNVAITRARKSLHVFSSLLPDDIDLSRTAAEGVRDLKHFLDYARRGSEALGEAISAPGGDFDSPFEEAVAERLKREGWNVHVQVGVSGFRIDLAVVHPDAPGKYLAGIECDGATYHRGATARDRDLLRQEILESKGWRIERIWSTDWWVDPDGALSKVISALNGFLAEDREIAAAQAKIEEEESRQESLSTKNESESPDPIPEVAAEIAGSSQELRVEDELSKPAAADELGLDPDRFFDANYTKTLKALVIDVLEEQVPMRLDSLYRQVARRHGFQRAGGRIQQRVNRLVPGSEYKPVKDDGHMFLWRKDQPIESWNKFRDPTPELKRSADEVPFPELAILAREVLSEGHEGDGAIREMGKRLGYSTLKGTSRTRASKAIASAIRHTTK